MVWEGASKSDLKGFPLAVQKDIGVALFVVQLGGMPPSAKPWRGLGSGIFELAEDRSGNAYRCVFASKFPDAVYVLHAFLKKSKSGIKTPMTDVALIERRWKRVAARRARGLL